MISQAIKIEPATRYRLQFRYTASPVLHVFVKGYTLVADGKGTVEREIYRRHVPVSGGTDGNW